MNEERIKQLEDLGFVWALRGQEGSRRDESMLQDPENLQNTATPAESVPDHNSFAPNNPSNNPEDILDESSAIPAYPSLQEV